jgi:hypothetical protein
MRVGALEWCDLEVADGEVGELEAGFLASEGDPLKFGEHHFFGREGRDQDAKPGKPEVAEVVIEEPPGTWPAADCQLSSPGAVDRPDVHLAGLEIAVRVELAVVTGGVAGVASGPFRASDNQERVGFAVLVDAHQVEAVSAGCALLPELIAAAAPEGDETGAVGSRDRLPVHEPEHQHFARPGILNDGGNETSGIEGED